MKKVLKWMLIIIGLLAGMFFVGVQLLQKYGYVSSSDCVLISRECERKCRKES
jgi:uncharacterized membrane protein (Fun14 family)